jgi:hypothetical protein
MSSSTVDATTPATAPRPFAQTPAGRAFTALASLRLTVVLFSLSLVLVFVGTLAQTEESNWTVVGKYFRSWFVWVPFQLFVKLGQIFFGVSASAQLAPKWGFPFPGGWTLGILLLANLLAAHALRFKVTWKRTGILILHAGLIVLLVGELLTGLFSVESRMTLAEGETANFIDVSRTGLGAVQVELAITDSSDPKSDDVVVVPGSLLQSRKGGGLIHHDDLPVDVEVLEYLPNSTLVQVRGGPPRRDEFTSAVGAKFSLVPRSEAAGVDTDQVEDAVAARVRLLKKGTREEVGTYLVSLWFDRNFTRRLPFYRFPPQQFTLGDRTYTVELRPKREFLPYSLHLIEFRHDRYVGTDTPKNYSSLVQVTDPERGEDRQVLISMNQPLRRFAHGGLVPTWLFNGETFFQSSFLDPEETRLTGTVLQVVRNPGWLMPYLSCTLVTLGMGIHFGIHLFGFLKRRAAT